VVLGLRKRPWGRIVAGAVAALILVIAVNFLFASAQARSRADAARVAEPIRLAVDFSKPNTYMGKLSHTFCNACSDCLEIVTESPFASPEDAMKIAEGLKGRLTITDSQGTVITERSFGPEIRCTQVASGRWVPIIEFGYFPEGTYDLKLSIDAGAPLLVSVPHTLVGRYQLCGIEYIPAQILWLLGIGGCSLSVLIGLVIVVVTVKKRRDSLALLNAAVRGRPANQDRPSDSSR
jgi:hypothetical protein